MAHGPLISISLHREICVKDFSGSTTPRISKFDTNFKYDLLYCVRENQHPHAHYSLYFVHFFSPRKSSSQISQLL